MSGIMSGIFDETGSQEETSNSFWEIGNYKHTVKRIDDGHRLCNDLMNCIQERAKIEKSYSQQLTEWSKRWRQLIDKGPQYGTVERGWLALMTEAEKVSELHQGVRDSLMNRDFEKVKNWQKDTYHKQMMGGFKETREADESFKKAQKPWAKKLKELEAAKKFYHMACKDKKLASVREANSKTENPMMADQQRKLSDKLDKCKQESEKAKEKYLKALDELNKCTEPYIESMEQVFDQCQQFEEKRLHFIREVLLDMKHHLNLTEDQSYATVYRELELTVTSVSPKEDLKWFFNIHGPGMEMNWPHFEEYNPDLSHNISKKERSKKGSDGVMLTNVMPAVDHCPSGDQQSISNYGKNHTYTASVDQATAYADEDSNGGFNPFNKDTDRGVRVRALYHYEGQEQDELSFKAGDELTKLEDEDEQGWCKGRLDNGKLGLYPANYVELI